MCANFLQAQTKLLNSTVGLTLVTNRVIGLISRSFNMVRASAFKELIAFRGTKVSQYHFKAVTVLY